MRRSGDSSHSFQGSTEREREDPVWRMQDGDRVLTPAEWTLFSMGLAELRHEIEQDIEARTDEVQVGITVFDSLSAEQKLIVIAEVSRALREEKVPAPKHTACNEGAIMAVFSTLRAELEVELDVAQDVPDDPPVYFRRALLNASRESGPREEVLPAEDCMDLEEWDWLLEEIQERIFWDSDFSMGDAFLDLPPEQARMQMDLAGIDPEYYLSVPAEPDEQGLNAVRQTLARLLVLPIPNDDGVHESIDDLYHSLTIGPCSSEMINACRDHPWIEIIGLAEPGWDCDYPTWIREFRDKIPMTPFELRDDLCCTLKDLPEDVRVEQRGDHWGIRDEEGSWWSGLLDNCWSEAPDDPEVPALAFETMEEAVSAFVQASQMYQERSLRYRAVMERLHPPSSDNDLF